MKLTSTLPLLATLAILPAASHAALLAHYPFDSDFTDAGGSNDLTIDAGTPTITTTAADTKFGGGAAEFLSTESNVARLALANTITFGGSDAWSIAFWGKRETSTNRQGMVIGDLDSSDFIWLSDGGGGVSGIRFRNSSGTSIDNAAQPANSFPDDGMWHHWALSATGSQITIYRDNASLGTVSVATTFTATHVGQAFNSNAQSMNGQIDELYIFAEAIDSDTVDNLYSTNTIPEPGSLLLLGLAGLAVLRRRR